MKTVALIFAGGVGQRMGSDIPKQFLKVRDKEIIIHTIEKFENNEKIDDIYVICVKEWIDYLKERLTKFGITKVKDTIPGGETGQDSIFIGLQRIKEDNNNAIVLIHDGVRPLITDKTIEDCIEAVLEYGSGITVTPIIETPIQSLDEDKVFRIPLRKEMYTAQAPQGFYLKDIFKAHLEERSKKEPYKGIVDSCSLMFSQGVKPHIVIGNRGNIKVTTPEDYCTLIGNYASNDYEEFLNLVERRDNSEIYQNNR